MFKIIKDFNQIIILSFLCIFLGIITFLTFIGEGFIELNDKNLSNTFDNRYYCSYNFFLLNF